MADRRRPAFRLAKPAMVTLAALALAATLGLAWALFNVTLHRHGCVGIDDDLFLGYAAVVDLGNPDLRPEVVMKTADGVPVTGPVDLTGRGPFAAVADAAGPCPVRWDDALGFHGGCPSPERAGTDPFDTPFHRVSGDILRDLRHPRLWCRTRALTW